MIENEVEIENLEKKSDPNLAVLFVLAAIQMFQASDTPRYAREGRDKCMLVWIVWMVDRRSIDLRRGGGCKD